jgi:hypothetical protein
MYVKVRRDDQLGLLHVCVIKLKLPSVITVHACQVSRQLAVFGRLRVCWNAEVCCLLVLSLTNKVDAVSSTFCAALAPCLLVLRRDLFQL